MYQKLYVVRKCTKDNHDLYWLMKIKRCTVRSHEKVKAAKDKRCHYRQEAIRSSVVVMSGHVGSFGCTSNIYLLIYKIQCHAYRHSHDVPMYLPIRSMYRLRCRSDVDTGDTAV